MPSAAQNTPSTRRFSWLPNYTQADDYQVELNITDGALTDSETITITVNVLGGGVIEEILNFFDSAAQSLGLNDLFGSDGKFVLLLLIVVIILFLIIILAIVFTSKPVHIICTNRIREIESTEKAIFEITLKNPYKKIQSYDIEAQQTAASSKWEITIDPVTTTIEGKATKTVQVTVTPTEAAGPKEWTEVTVSVKKTGKKHKESIDLVTTMKEGKTLLQLQNVSHWPTTFNPGERILTSFNLSNSGSIAARNVKVFFYLNGKQKNKVEVTLPAGNIADIQIPWIAVKGKNHVRIRIKE
jgi:PKD repeat protein